MPVLFKSFSEHAENRLFAFDTQHQAFFRPEVGNTRSLPLAGFVQSFRRHSTE